MYFYIKTYEPDTGAFSYTDILRIERFEISQDRPVRGASLKAITSSGQVIGVAHSKLEEDELFLEAVLTTILGACSEAHKEGMTSVIVDAQAIISETISLFTDEIKEGEYEA